MSAHVMMRCTILPANPGTWGGGGRQTNTQREGRDTRPMRTALEREDKTAHRKKMPI
jgi:hypothetical protein